MEWGEAGKIMAGVLRGRASDRVVSVRSKALSSIAVLVTELDSLYGSYDESSTNLFSVSRIRQVITELGISLQSVRNDCDRTNQTPDHNLTNVHSSPLLDVLHRRTLVFKEFFWSSICWTLFFSFTFFDSSSSVYQKLMCFSMYEIIVFIFFCFCQ